MSRPDNATLKRALQASFPATRFSVTRGRGTGYGWTHITWTDGPTRARLEERLAELGAAPGHMDITDYFDGERVNTTRHLSDAAEQSIAAALLAPMAVPPRAEWGRVFYCYDLHQCIYRVSANRQQFADERIRANCWLDRWLDSPAFSALATTSAGAAACR